MKRWTLHARRAHAAFILAAGLLAVSAPAMAEEEKPQPKLCPICSKLEGANPSYGEKAGNTFTRGLLNFGLGWTEMIRQPGKAAREGKDVFHGVANGLAFSARRTLRGIGEVLTFWTPKIQDEYIHFSDDCPIDTMQ